MQKYSGLKYSKFGYFIFLLSFLSVLISSCAKDADPKKMVVDTIPGAYFGKYTDAVAVQSVSGGEKTSPVGKPRISNDSFAEALKQSFSANGLLNESHPKYLLSADITNLYQPLVGNSIGVTGAVIYRITDARTGALVYNKTVYSKATTSEKEEHFYVAKMKMSNEGTIKANIQGLLDSLLNR